MLWAALTGLICLNVGFFIGSWWGTIAAAGKLEERKKQSVDCDDPAPQRTDREPVRRQLEMPDMDRR